MLGTVLATPGSNIAHAAESTATVEQGELSVDAITVGNFTAVTLEGVTQTVHTNIDPFSVVDASGSGAGWNIVMKATPLTDSMTNRTLPEGSLTIDTVPSIAKIDENSSSIDTITTRTGTIDGTGLTLLSAAENGGMGSYSISFTNAAEALSLNLKPATAKTGTYTSTITVSINSGP
nr:WxL domain-containing protein [Salirhabdus salicampi]